MAWLLATSRILGANGELAHQEAFAQALRAQGFNVDNSRISRWESGAKPLSNKVIAAYERLLGAPEGGLLAVAAGVYRLGDAPTPAAKRSRAEIVSQQELDDAFTVAESGRATGADWLRLATALQDFDRIYLNAATWQALCARLINEFSRSVGAAYVRRNEACRALLANPVARRHMVRAIGEVVTNPHAQVVQPALSLLSELEDPAAGGLVLRLLDSDRALVRRAAASIAPAKLARSQFSSADIPRLEAFSVRSIRSSTSMAVGLHAYDLAASMPDDSFDRIAATVRDSHQLERLQLARSHGQLVPVETSRAIARNLATEAQDATGAPFATDPDTMLQRLVSEALFHAHRERRHHAATLIGASTYAPAVADGCIGLVGQGTEFLSTRALALSHTIGLARKRDVVVRHAVTDTNSVAVRVRALNALAANPQELDEDETNQVHELTAAHHPTAVRQAALFAVGMNAHELIPGLERHEDTWLAARAKWWSEHGSALRDEDDDHTRQPTANPSWIPAPRGH